MAEEKPDESDGDSESVAEDHRAEPAAPTPAPVDWETRFKYLLADFENYRRRTDRDGEAALVRGAARVLSAVIPLYEGFEKAREAVSHLPRTDPVRRGLDLLEDEWKSLLTREGVATLARVGEPFRADVHEAVADAPPKTGAPDGTVAEVVQQGYKFKGGLLRTAKVVVSRRPPPSPAVEAAEAPSAEE